MADVGASKSFGQQEFHRLAEDLVAVVPEGRFHARVGVGDPASLIDGEDGIRRRLENREMLPSGHFDGQPRFAGRTAAREGLARP